MAQYPTCPVCGNNIYKFDKKRMKMVCTGCTTSMDYLEDEKKKMEYSVNYAKAMSYLKAGYYGEAYGCLSRLLHGNLLNKELFYTTLIAATENFTNLDPKDKSGISHIWNNLVRLHCVTDRMRDYSERVWELRREAFAEEKGPLKAYIFSSGGLFIISGILFSLHRYFWFSIMLFFAIGLFGGIFSCGEPGKIAKRAELFAWPDSWDENPFKNADKN